MVLLTIVDAGRFGQFRRARQALKCGASDLNLAELGNQRIRDIGELFDPQGRLIPIGAFRKVAHELAQPFGCQIMAQKEPQDLVDAGTIGVDGLDRRLGRFADRADGRVDFGRANDPGNLQAVRGKANIPPNGPHGR